VIAGNSVESSRLQGRPSEEIASSHYEPYLNTNTHQLANLEGHLI
jgi:hypothetical protein